MSRTKGPERERWSSRVGLILAMAGNAIGLGNFLRFPVQAVENGGGAYIIPYFISFILLGIPLMWIEWSIGRYGGSLNHGTAPGMFDALWKNPIAKYIGILGIFIPLIILTYYTYIASWTLAFSIFSLLGLLPEGRIADGITPAQYLKPFEEYLGSFIGATGKGIFLTPDLWAYIFFLFTVAFSLYILSRGVAGGIERLADFAIPTLFVMALILFVRVLTLESPTGADVSPVDGLAFLWEPRFEGLTSPKVWLAAAGQIFFTLSLGLGAILTYASYLRRDDDIALNGLTTASLNEFAEIVLGGTISIVSAVVFFGVAGAKDAASGAFKLGFISMPAILSHMPLGNLFGFMWFFLLFFAAITSVMALSQPVIAFFEDELFWSRKKSVAVLGIIFFVSAHLPIFLKGALDEMDFWAGTFGLVVFALFEVVIFVWIFGSERAWEEINRSAQIRIPHIFYFIMKYITPLFLIVILATWSYTELPKVLAKKDGTIWITRIFLILVLLGLFALVRMAWEKREAKG